MEKISIGILTYNHEQFIEKCLQSVLALSYNNLEIVISDDCSADLTTEVIKKTLSQNFSKHKIIINFNEQNLGLAGNFNKTFYELSTGDFMITLGGDDYISYDYLEEAVEIFKHQSELKMLDFNAFILKDDHILPPPELPFSEKVFSGEDYLKIRPVSSFAPGRIFRKELITKFPKISLKCPTEDSVLVNRALLVGNLMRSNKAVVHYRKHQNNISSKENLKKISNISIISQYIKDCMYLYENGSLREEIFLKFLKRYQYEYFKREIHYSDLNKYFKIILRKGIKIIYKLR